MDLYSLLKDMLVKMISTIQEETEKKYKDYESYKRKWKTIKSEVICCSFPDCDAMMLSRSRIMLKCYEIRQCVDCSSLICNKHLLEFFGSPLCKECFHNQEKND